MIQGGGKRMVMIKVNRVLFQLSQMYQNGMIGVENSKEQVHAVVAEMKTMTPEEMKAVMNYYVVCFVLFSTFYSILSISCF